MIRNEKGSALLTTLLIMVVFAIIGTLLISMNLSATKQFSKKEEDIQARHLAEMGIIHYKTVIQNSVDEANKEYDQLKDTFDEDDDPAEEYREILKERLSKANNNIKSNNKVDGTTGYYFLELENKDIEFKKDSTEVKLPITSKGKVKDTAKSIKAELTVKADGEIESESSSGEEPGNSTGEKPEQREVPEIPTFPTNAPQVSFLDNIDDKIKAAKVVYGQMETYNNPFATDAFVKILGSVDMQKKSNWTFNNHLLIGGNLKMNTAGNNLSTLYVRKDFAIGGTLHTNNLINIKVDGNLMIMGNSNFGTKSVLEVHGNALFDSPIEVIDTHAVITIGQDAYFRAPIGGVKNKASICIKGNSYLWKNSEWAEYEGIKKYIDRDSCPKNSGDNSIPTPSHSWILEDNLNAEYQ